LNKPAINEFIKFLFFNIIFGNNANGWYNSQKINPTRIPQPTTIKTIATIKQSLSGGNNVNPKTTENTPQKHNTPPKISTFGSINFGILGSFLLTIKPNIHIITLISKQALQSTH